MNPKERATIAISVAVRDEFRDSLPRSAEMQGTVEALVRWFTTLPPAIKACFAYELGADVTAVVVAHLLAKGELDVNHETLAKLGIGTSDTEARPPNLPPRGHHPSGRSK